MISRRSVISGLAAAVAAPGFHSQLSAAEIVRAGMRAGDIMLVKGYEVYTITGYDPYENPITSMVASPGEARNAGA